MLYSTNAANVLASEQRDTHVSPGDFAGAAGPAVKQALQGCPTVDTASANGRLYELIHIIHLIVSNFLWNCARGAAG